MQNEKIDIEYLQKAGKTDFYSNDREFLNIIKKLTEQSASLNNKAISLVSLLNEAEQIKLEMIQKELALGLSQESKPYGFTNIEFVKNVSFKYESKKSESKSFLEKFIYVLENYFEVEDLSMKRSMLMEAKVALESLRSSDINPLHFIISPQRAKVWYILESAYSKTLKKINIDFFITRIRATRLKHISAVDGIREYHRNRKETIFKLSEAREKESDSTTIKALQNELKKDMSVDVKPLLIDTQKIMDSLDFMLEELPEELNNEQLKELEAFLPTLAEYYTDQTYTISGGESFTPLAKNLAYLQKLIDEDAAAKVLLDAVEQLGYSMQHLYILHWIGESLLKNVLSCYHYGCSMGATIKFYQKNYEKTKTSFGNIQRAVFFRNDIAHNGVVWKPEKIKVSIISYRDYIEKVAREQKIKLEKFYLPKMDRKLTQEQKQKRTQEYLFRALNVKPDTLGEKLATKIAKELESCGWSLPQKREKYFKRQIDKTQKEAFVMQYFNMSFETLKENLIVYEKSKPDPVAESELEKKAVGFFTYAFRGLQEDSKEFKDAIKELQKRIESVSDVRFEKGGFSSWFK